MVNVISFSLWGRDPKYCVGAVRNAELAAEFYPDWRCIFQLDALVPVAVWDALHEIDNVDVVRRIDPQTNGLARGNWTAMFWRFEYANAVGVEAMISRDCDSRLSRREAAAVEEWLESDKGFHTIHDHFHHSVPILGGLWGMKKNCLPEFNALMYEWLSRPLKDNGNYWQVDQDFLFDIVWPRVAHDTMNHAEFHTNIWPGQSIPMSRNGREFIGAAYDENDQIDQDQVRALYGG